MAMKKKVIYPLALLPNGCIHTVNNIICILCHPSVNIKKDSIIQSKSKISTLILNCKREKDYELIIRHVYSGS